MEGRLLLLFLKPAARVSAMLLLCLVAGSALAASESDEALLEDNQPVKPEVKRRVISEAQIDTENFEIGGYGGVYSVQNYGANTVVGFRFAYHVTEDFFVELTAGETETEPSLPEKRFNFNALSEDERKLTYYNASVGYNLFPGESFVTDNWVFKSAFYLTAGVGNTDFAGESQFTISYGTGYRLIATDWLALHVDFKDHIFKLDIFGEETTHNLELIVGATVFF